MDREVIELTRRLVSINSENPGGSEAGVAAYVAEWLKAAGFADVRVFDAAPGRPDVVARAEGGDSSLPPLAFVGHMDTVPVGAGWTTDPFGSTEKDGKLYGRGSADMKGGLAASMVAARDALRDAAESGRPLQRTLLVCGTADEEGTHMLGADGLMREGVIGGKTLILAPEGTGMEVIVAHKGVMWYELTTKGKMSHAGSPEVGVDAIYGLTKLIGEIKARFGALPYGHPLTGVPTVTFSVIGGGVKTNVVPDFARVEIDVRAVSPMTSASVLQMLTEVAESAPKMLPGLTAAVRQINIDRPPVESDLASPLLAVLNEAYASVLGERPEPRGLRGYTDASITSHRTGNVDAFVFGPGSIKQAHTADEWVSVEDLAAAVRIYRQTIERLCF